MICLPNQELVWLHTSVLVSEIQSGDDIAAGFARSQYPRTDSFFRICSKCTRITARLIEIGGNDRSLRGTQRSLHQVPQQKWSSCQEGNDAVSDLHGDDDQEN